jgi:EXLDI family protein
VPNKTIYVSDGDMPLYQRAQELAGGNLSSAISAALRRYVEVEEGRKEGFEEVHVRVGPGKGRKVRFVAVPLGMWTTEIAGRWTVYRVFRSRGGKYVLHVARSPEYTDSASSGNWVRDLFNWRMYLGTDNRTLGYSPGESTLEVFETVEALKDKVPPELFEMVAPSAVQTAEEDLDI